MTARRFQQFSECRSWRVVSESSWPQVAIAEGRSDYKILDLYTGTQAARVFRDLLLYLAMEVGMTFERHGIWFLCHFFPFRWRKKWVRHNMCMHIYILYIYIYTYTYIYIYIYHIYIYIYICTWYPRFGHGFFSLLKKWVFGHPSPGCWRASLITPGCCLVRSTAGLLSPLDSWLVWFLAPPLDFYLDFGASAGHLLLSSLLLPGILNLHHLPGPLRLLVR